MRTAPTQKADQASEPATGGFRADALTLATGGFRADALTLACGGLYGLAWAGSLLAASPYLAGRAVIHGPEMRERMGAWGKLGGVAGDVMWVHAASMGETRGALPLLSALRARGCLPVLSVVTPAAHGLAGEAVAAGAHLVRFAPFDFQPLMGRLMKHLQPRALLICETELWPGMLGEAARRQIPVAFVSARLTPGGARRMRWLRPWLRRLLRTACVAAQSQGDAERWMGLGALPERVTITGNTKYECPCGPISAETRRRARGAWRHVIVLGSVRSAEAGAVAEALSAAAQLPAPSLFVVVPRHPDRADQILRRLRGCLPVTIERTQKQEPLIALPEPSAAQEGHCLLLVRTIGELRRFYALADLAFVGGTLCPVGGHNLFEAAELGVPVLYGPHTEQVADVVAALEGAGGGQRVEGGRALGARIVRLITSPVDLAASCAGAHRAAGQLGGAVERTLKALVAWGFPVSEPTADP